MNTLRCASILIVVACGLVAGHYHEGHGYSSHGVHSKEVGYAVETKHGHNYGHGGGHAEHHSVHGYSGNDGHDAVHFADYEAGHYSGHSEGHDYGHDDGHYDHHAYPKYDFSYGVKDTKTGDIKSHTESRDGGSVKGSYTLKEADGTTRYVEYTADKHKGFNAVVHTTGHAGHYDHGYGHDGHYDHGYGHGGHASSYTIVKKQEEKKY